MIYTTTLNKIRKYRPCTDGWVKLLDHLNKTKADDELLPLSVILQSNGLDDALWCLRASDAPKDIMRLFARLCALDVIHLWDAPSLVRQYLETGDESLREKAGAASKAAAWDSSAGAAAWAAAWAASKAAAWNVSKDAAWTASKAAAWAAAWTASKAAAWTAAWAAARELQTKRFVELFCTKATGGE